MGGDRPHTLLLRECEGFPIMRDGVLGIEPAGAGCDIAEQMLRMGGEARLLPRGFERAFGKAQCIVKPIK